MTASPRTRAVSALTCFGCDDVIPAGDSSVELGGQRYHVDCCPDPPGGDPGPVVPAPGAGWPGERPHLDDCSLDTDHVGACVPGDDGGPGPEAPEPAPTPIELTARAMQVDLDVIRTELRVVRERREVDRRRVKELVAADVAISAAMSALLRKRVAQ